MTFHLTFSDRQKLARGGDAPATFAFDVLPQRLRGQIIYVLDEALGDCDEGYELWDTVEWTYMRSLGLERLETPAGTTTNVLGVFATGSDPHLGTIPEERIKSFLRRAPVPDVLDMLDLCLSTLAQSKIARFSKRLRNESHIVRDVPSTFEEINQAFLRNGVGYKFEGGELLRVTDEIMHSQVVERHFDCSERKAFKAPSTSI